MDQIVEKLKSKINLLAIIAFSLSAITVIVLSSKKPIPKTNEPVRSADTYIPDGFVLVPIEILNSKSLDSIIGQYGVVDLYLPSANPKEKPIKVAKRLKLLRAPLNPDVFAVLAPEDRAPKLVSIDRPFIAMVQNPRASGTKIEKIKKRRKRIFYESIGD